MRYVYFLVFFIIALMFTGVPATKKKTKHKLKNITTTKGSASTIKKCQTLDHAMIARYKSCFLRPDTGPCRADIIQWYFDVQPRKCYRFFWGGCQGNGNRFETKEECESYCYLNKSKPPRRNPFYCDLAYDYGTCFGAYKRYYYDKLTQSCRPRLFSGCGGNNNNFETQAQCMRTCIQKPYSTLDDPNAPNVTICYNLDIPELN